MPPSLLNHRQNPKQQSDKPALPRAAKAGRRCCLGAVVALILANGALAQVFKPSALEAGVKQGDVKAMLRLAQAYELGEGVEKNFPKSNFLYCSAAQLGDVQAQFKLGWIYANGRALSRDVEVAAGLLRGRRRRGTKNLCNCATTCRPNSKFGSIPRCRPARSPRRRSNYKWQENYLQPPTRRLYTPADPKVQPVATAKLPQDAGVTHQVHPLLHNLGLQSEKTYGAHRPAIV